MDHSKKYEGMEHTIQELAVHMRSEILQMESKVQQWKTLLQMLERICDIPLTQESRTAYSMGCEWRTWIQEGEDDGSVQSEDESPNSGCDPVDPDGS